LVPAPLSQEQFKLETSNLARILIMTGTNNKDSKVGRRGSGGVTWPTFRIMEPPPYLGKGSN